MCDLIKLSSVRILAVVERLYGAPIPCGARRDLALESGLDQQPSRREVPNDNSGSFGNILSSFALLRIQVDY